MFGPVKLIKNADFDKDKYSDYGIGFDARKSFCLSDSSEFGKNVITFSVDMSLSGHVDHWLQRENMLQILVSNVRNFV